MFEVAVLTFKTTGEGKDLISDFLLGMGAMSVAEDIDKGSGFLISAYFSRQTDIEHVIDRLKVYIDFLKGHFSNLSADLFGVEEIDSSSWEIWRKLLKTVRASRRIVIKPPWEDYRIKKDEILIEINPSVAFGTGHHETTRLCIRAVEEILTANDVNRILDIGCGSGILAIAAVKMGVNEAIGFDNDKIAVREAKNNTLRNSVTNKVKLFSGYLESVKGVYDLITANISVEATIKMRSGMKSRLAKRGKLVVSGIPTMRKAEALRGLEKEGFYLEKEYIDGEWVAMVFSCNY